MTMTIDNGHLRLTWWDVKRWKLTRPDDIPRTTLRIKILQDDADDANVGADADDDEMLLMMTKMTMIRMKKSRVEVMVMVQKSSSLQVNLSLTSCQSNLSARLLRHHIEK